MPRAGAWRRLHAALKKHIPPGPKLDATVSAWYRLHFGKMPNQREMDLSESFEAHMQRVNNLKD